MDNYRQINPLRQANRMVQVILSLSLAVLVNALALCHFSRVDLTSGRKYSLSVETKAYLEAIQTPVQVIVTEPPEDANAVDRLLFDDLSGLVREYEFFTQQGGLQPVTLEVINIYRQRDRAEELVQVYGISPEKRNAMVVIAGERFKEIEPAYLYDEDKQRKTYTFKGEQALTSALLELTSPRKPVVYFVEGHGEMKPDDVDPLRGMSRAGQYLRNRNWEVKFIDLSLPAPIPEDASLVVVASPRNRFLPSEQSRLSSYMKNRSGKLLVLLDPVVDHGLEDLLYEWGILADDRLIFETASDSVVPGGDTLITRFAQHPITEPFLKNNLKILVGLTRPVREDPAAPSDDTRKVYPLMATSEESWAEADYRQKTASSYDEARDLGGPLPIATAAERVADNGVGVSLVGGRIAVLGNSTVFSNALFGVGGNQQLFHTLTGWLTRQSAVLLNIRPREWQNIELTLSRKAYYDLFFHLLALPAAFLMASGVVALLRNR